MGRKKFPISPNIEGGFGELETACADPGIMQNAQFAEDPFAGIHVVIAGIPAGRTTQPHYRMRPTAIDGSLFQQAPLAWLGKLHVFSFQHGADVKFGPGAITDIDLPLDRSRFVGFIDLGNRGVSDSVVPIRPELSFQGMGNGPVLSVQENFASVLHGELLAQGNCSRRDIVGNPSIRKPFEPKKVGEREREAQGSLGHIERQGNEMPVSRGFHLLNGFRCWFGSGKSARSRQQHDS